MPKPSSHEPPPPERHARLFLNGRNQALRIPRELELDCEEVRITREGVRLILEPGPKATGLAELLASWEPLPEGLPDIDEGLLPLDDVEL